MPIATVPASGRQGQGPAYLADTLWSTCRPNPLVWWAEEIGERRDMGDDRRAPPRPETRAPATGRAGTKLHNVDSSSRLRAGYRLRSGAVEVSGGETPHQINNLQG